MAIDNANFLTIFHFFLSGKIKHILHKLLLIQKVKKKRERKQPLNY